jgi:hypothetical protein
VILSAIVPRTIATNATFFPFGVLLMTIVYKSTLERDVSSILNASCRLSAKVEDHFPCVFFSTHDIRKSGCVLNLEFFPHSFEIMKPVRVGKALSTKDPLLKSGNLLSFCDFMNHLPIQANDLSCLLVLPSATLSRSNTLLPWNGGQYRLNLHFSTFDVDWNPN